jgi:AmmeMemoRadiSam system protein A/AmmeMemoRadiSam system protein B
MPHPPILLPEVGKGEEKKIQSTFDACKTIGEEIKEERPETIIIISPHGPVFSDAIAVSFENLSGNLLKFGAPNVGGTIEIDQELTDKIIRKAEGADISVVELDHSTSRRYGITYELDHGAIIPLYFTGLNYKFVHITYGMLGKIDLYRFGMVIKEAVKQLDRKVALIASGDLSHRLLKEGPYPYSEYGEVFDKTIVNLLSEGNVLDIFTLDSKMCQEAGECGLRSIYIMLGAIDGKFKGELLSYEGPFGVGYSVMRFKQKNEHSRYDELVKNIEEQYVNKTKNEEIHVKLARESLTHYVLNGEYLKYPKYANALKNKRSGVFVSIKKEGQLRGCIGTMQPTTDSIGDEIIHNAVSAAINDPRFTAISESELTSLDISVDVLNEPTPATKHDLNPKKYGVIVRRGLKSGVLLPNLEGINTVEQQLSIVLKKAGITNDNYTIERFEVIRYE